MIMFKDEEFLVYDCAKQDWQLGDFNDTSLIVPLNAAVISIDPQQTTEFHAISVGGRRFNQETGNCFGIQFFLNE